MKTKIYLHIHYWQPYWIIANEHWQNVKRDGAPLHPVTSTYMFQLSKWCCIFKSQQVNHFLIIFDILGKITIATFWLAISFAMYVRDALTVITIQHWILKEEALYALLCAGFYTKSLSSLYSSKHYQSSSDLWPLEIAHLPEHFGI